MAKQSGGYNESEKYLNILCYRSFLSLWSYSNLYRKVGQELCDALVVVGNRVLIFSDKRCEYKIEGNLDVNWQRWFKSAIEKSASQLWGARNWIERDRNRIFLDPQCSQRFPIDLLDAGDLEYHLIAVAHGSRQVAKDKWGGIGSMAVSNTVKGMTSHSEPCLIGDLDPSKSFIHVLDDVTLDILLENRDTINDFFDYLSKREALIRGPLPFWAEGEEDMLGHYLISINEKGEHIFDLPETLDEDKFLSFPIHWDDFQSHPQRKIQIEADKISYTWDRLIEHFIKYGPISNESNNHQDKFNDYERCIRLLAQETRFSRRVLSQIWTDAHKSTPSHFKRIRTFNNGDSCYIFLFFPGPECFPNYTMIEYMEAKDGYLEATCRVYKLLQPRLTFAVGISIESGFDRQTISPSLLYYEYSEWDQGWEEIARKEQIDLRILLNPESGIVTHKEFPDST